MNERNERAHQVRRGLVKWLSSQVRMTSNPEFDRRSGFQPGGIVTLARMPNKESKEWVDPTGNIRLTETEYRDNPLGIFTVYRPQKANGPMRVHTQAVNRIRRKGLMEEPIDVKKFLYDTLERMVETFREERGSIIIGGISIKRMDQTQK